MPLSSVGSKANDCCFNDTLYSNVYWKRALIRGNANSNIGQSRAKYNE